MIQSDEGTEPPLTQFQRSHKLFLTGISLRIGHFLKANYDSQNDHSSWYGGITDFHWTMLSFSRFLAFFGRDRPSLETTCPPARLALPSPGATLVTPAPPAAPTAPVVDFLSERLGICGKETSPKEVYRRHHGSPMLNIRIIDGGSPSGNKKKLPRNNTGSTKFQGVSGQQMMKSGATKEISELV